MGHQNLSTKLWVLGVGRLHQAQGTRYGAQELSTGLQYTEQTAGSGCKAPASGTGTGERQWPWHQEVTCRYWVLGRRHWVLVTAHQPLATGGTGHQLVSIEHWESHKHTGTTHGAPQNRGSHSALGMGHHIPVFPSAPSAQSSLPAPPRALAQLAGWKLGKMNQQPHRLCPCLHAHPMPGAAASSWDAPGPRPVLSKAVRASGTWLIPCPHRGQGRTLARVPG